MNNIDLITIQNSAQALTSELDFTIKKMINGSTLDEKTLTFLLHLTKMLSPEVILELGSGTSTSVFGSYLANNPEKHLISIDNFAYFAEKAVENLDDKQQIISITAPIELTFYKGCPLLTYSKKILSTLKKFPAIGLVLIDGPNGRIFWRDSILVLLAAFLHKDAIILLDDSARIREQESLEILKNVFGSRIEINELAGFNKGLAVIRLNGALPGPYTLKKVLSRYFELPVALITYLKYKKSVTNYIKSKNYDKC